MAIPMSSPLSRLTLVAACVVVPVAVVVVLAPWRRNAPPVETKSEPPPADPRLAYSGPYLNVHPDVKFVGTQKCLVCHDDYHTFLNHPMGRSASTVGQANQRTIEQGHGNPVSALGSELRIDREGDRVWQREVRRGPDGAPIYVNSFEAHFVIGSGNHGFSYLTNRDGYLFQTPISWYSQKQIWDLAPGWREIGGGRRIVHECLFCHIDRFEPVEGSVNRYREPLFEGLAIGCERCHGPGEKHVRAWGGGDKPPRGRDHTIVNPKHLEPKLREAICQQCHLEGEHRFVRRGRGLFDFRPGLPFEDFWSVFVQAEGENPNAVNHVEQMYFSRCFKSGVGQSNQMGCISCHDPHVKVQPEKRVVHYRNSCLKCHDQKGCNVPEPERRKTNREDSCIDCHMPRSLTADIAHTASSDHRILRRPAPRSTKHERATEARSAVRSFFPVATSESERDMGIALAHLFATGKGDGGSATESLKLLDRWLARAPDDADAWLEKAQALRKMTRNREALAAFRQVLRLKPNRESAVSEAALILTELRDYDEALPLWQKAVELNPQFADYHANLAQLLRAKNDWPGARRHVETWLRLDPGSVRCREMWIDVLRHDGESAKAQAERAKLDLLRPK